MRPSETADSLHGRCLAGRYRLVEMIGSGGAGNVWAAVDEVLQRRVAVKDVGAPPWLSVESWEALRERTLREARAAAAISHPNVVTVYDVVEEDDRPWIVMQLVEARTLSQLIEQEGPCPPHRVAEIGLQVLAALQAAHAHGILHRDVKPSNVLVCDDGRAVLTDFGIAAVDGDVALTASGVLVGAPAYIAPERVQGGAAGPASDLWSLGATMYTAVEGRPPYRRDGAISTIAAVVHDDPDPTLRAGVLGPLLTVLLRRNPEQRPNAEQVERFLHAIVSPPVGPTAEVAAAAAVAELTAVLPSPAVPAASALADPLSHTPPHGVSATAETRHTPAFGAVAAGAPKAVVRRSDGEPRRVRTFALLTAAATALMAILLTGYLARHTLEPGSPTHQPAGNETPGPEPVADVHGGSSAPVAGDQRRGGSGPAGPTIAPTGRPTTQVTTEVGQQVQPTTSQPAEATVTPTSDAQPTTTTTEQTTTTTEQTQGGDETTSAAVPALP